MSRSKSGWLAALGLLLLGGCDVGPAYVPPSDAVPSAFKETSAAAYRNMLPGTWRPAQPQDAALKGKWWELFNEPELDALEEQLTINNQTIAQYFQNFMAARAQVRQARAGYFPTVTASPAYTRNGTGASSPINTYALDLDASWAPDLWDRVRNTVREYQSAAQVSAADLENERLTEQAALAEYYFELRGQDALQEVYDRTIVADRQAVELTRSLVQTGIDQEQAVAEAQVTLADAEATGAGIATNRALYEHAIATLTGQTASNFALPVEPLTTPVPAIPVTIPSLLLQRRPDVAAAERSMAQANALIGVEEAAYYPDLSLTGSSGLSATALKNLFSLPALTWSLGASASETLFNGGLREATVDQYTANYRANLAAYRQTVLTAFQQVEDYAATLRITSQQIMREDAAVKAAQYNLDISLAQYHTGLQPYLTVITAQTTLLSDQQSAVTLRVNEMVAAVQLIQALGGGWNASQLPTPAQVSTE